MPLRPLNREQTWLFPPTLDEVLPQDHPARFVAEFVDALDRSGWSELGVEIDGEALGAPAYHPRGLLSVWLYGFMTGVRSCRKLEGACRDHIPYLWLTGWQHPDHNTLWRFYRDHRGALRKLFKRTVRMAVTMGLVDLAVQAVDGTKITANAANDRTYDAEGLERVLERVEAAICDLEAQNEAGEDAVPTRLPKELAKKEALREQVQQAMQQLAGQEEQQRINLTDSDAGLMKARGGIVTGYNAQAMVSPLQPATSEGTGLVITAADVVRDANDCGQLTPMLQQAEEVTGGKAQVTLADAGYHSGANLEACAQREQEVIMPENQHKALEHPYHKDRFRYDKQTDSYTCPQGQILRFTRLKQTRGTPMRLYRASGAICRVCPAFGICTRDGRHGRGLEVGPHEAVLRRHRVWMSTEEAKEAYKQRMQLPEPAFGIVKEQQGARRFLLRGIVNVSAEWVLLATSFNLRTLWRIWRDWGRLRWGQSWPQAAITGP